MLRYVLRRVTFAVALVWLVSSAALVLARLAPGDFATESLGLDARPEMVAAARARAGLDRPLPAHYLAWLGGALRLDFGRSLAYDRPVRDLIPERAANTAVLAVTAIALATIVGVPLGIVTGTTRRRALSAVLQTASVVLLSAPPLLTSLVLVFVAARSGWVPVGGMQSADPGGLADRLRHMVVPVLALALPIGAMLERLQSQAMHEVMGQPFLLAARARGVPRHRLIWRDGFKAALGPFVSMYGVLVGTALSGSFAVEIVTSWPGLGRLMFEALRARDVYLVAGCAATGAVFLAAATLLADLVLAWTDPRTSNDAGRQ